MLGTHDLALFVVACLLLNVTPGPDMMYIIGRSTGQGWKAGAAATFGVSAGCSVHIAAAALGISALLTASATAFTILKLAGAAYLIYVGISMIRSPRITLAKTGDRPPFSGSALAQMENGGLSPVFWQGFLTNALNPKVALFFLAFLPQFIEFDAPLKPLAFVFLGAIFTFTATLWNLFVAWTAARMSAALGTRAVAWGQRMIGGFFVVLGVRLLAEESR